MASSNRSERVRFRYGICLNDSCEKCKSKEVQQISARKEFVCTDCGKALRECPPPRSFWDKNGKLVVGAVVVAVAAVVAGVMLLPGGDKHTEPVEQVDSLKNIKSEEDGMEVSEVNVTKMAFMEKEADMQLKPGEEKQLNVDCTPGNANESLTWTSSDKAVATVDESGRVKAVKAGTTTVTAVASRSKTSVSLKVTVKEEARKTGNTGGGGSVKNGQGHLELGYASYDGDIQNGQPHGNGTIVYKSSRKILPSKDYVASPGERVVGNFANGVLRMGTWYKNDGNQIVVK
ncbi:MAG: Ig-like domain-containing protein [Clostridium sp.]|nr:Ig-like domain-containing protein [Clostridium sp.]